MMQSWSSKGPTISGDNLPSQVHGKDFWAIEEEAIAHKLPFQARILKLVHATADQMHYASCAL